MELWVCGQSSQDAPWQFQGVFDSIDKAINACVDHNYFIAKVELNQKAPHEGVAWKSAFYPNCLLADAFCTKLYELNGGDKQALFDWLIERTDELFCAGKFSIVNSVFSRIAPEGLSAAAITGLLRSTYMARTELPARTEFLTDAVVARIMVESRGEEKARDFLTSMI